MYLDRSRAYLFLIYPWLAKRLLHSIQLRRKERLQQGNQTAKG
jgi:hypothetical protein